MKKTKLFLLCAMMSTSFCWAQEIEWQRRLGGIDFDYIYSIVSTNDKGFICGGTSNSGLSGDKTEGNWDSVCTPICSGDYWIIKLDSLGNIQWQNTIGGNSEDGLYSIKQTNDGGYICGGISYSPVSGDKTQGCFGEWDYWIIKLDANGNIQWQKVLGGNLNDWFYELAQTTDGGYVCGGWSESGVSGNKTAVPDGAYDYWVVKLDSIGNIQWQNSIGGDITDMLYSIDATTDGGSICGGLSFSNISGDKTENVVGGAMGSFDYWVVKLDSLGNIQWQNTIGGYDVDWLTNIRQMPSGGYICAGYSKSGISGDKTEGGCGDYDYWVVRLDSVGNAQWDKTITGGFDDYLNSINQTNDGGFLCGGSSQSPIYCDKVEPSWGVFDYWFVKLDSTGNIQWQNTIGGNQDDNLYSMCKTSDGNFIGAGYSFSGISGDKSINNWDPTLANPDIWLVKLTDTYNLITGKLFADVNSNFVQDSGEVVLSNKMIKETNTNRITFSNIVGVYSETILDTGNYSVYTNTPVNYYTSFPANHSVYFSAMHQVDSLNDFAFQPAGVFNDLSITITPYSDFTPGFDAGYFINYENIGTTTLLPTITMYQDSLLTLVNSTVNPNIVSPDSIQWSLPSLAPFHSGNILVTFYVDTNAIIDSIIYSLCIIEPVANEANPTDNFDTAIVIVTGSYDPNDILVSEDTLTTTQIATPPFLDYIIRFQNTGNDTAFAVKVLNPIDTNKLELSTIEFVNASHPVNLSWINYQRNMEFKFDNILLPDSNTNEPASHGFVHYRIKPKTTLLAGDSVTNNAYIYFDFNSPVATNTAVTKIVLPTNLTPNPSPRERGTLVCFPNPTANELTVSGYSFSANEKTEIKIVDVLGNVIFSARTTTSNHKLQTLNFSKGIYFVQVGTLRAKSVKQ